jgi:hypothetical protein
MTFDLSIINQTPQPINVLITAGSALFGAAIGGSVTYFVAYKRQKYELRRDAYLALIELRIKGSYPSPVGWRLDRNPTFSREIFFAKYKIDMIGSKKIKKIANEMVGLLYPNSEIEEEYRPSEPIEEPQERWDAFKHKCDTELKPAIKEELEGWWPFDPNPKSNDR